MIFIKPKSDAETLSDVLSRRDAFNAIENPNLGDLADSGLHSYAGRLSRPFGAWHCPACWMDYAKGKYTGAAA